MCLFSTHKSYFILLWALRTSFKKKNSVLESLITSRSILYLEIATKFLIFVISYGIRSRCVRDNYCEFQVVHNKSKMWMFGIKTALQCNFKTLDLWYTNYVIGQKAKDNLCSLYSRVRGLEDHNIQHKRCVVENTDFRIHLSYSLDIF